MQAYKASSAFLAKVLIALLFSCCGCGSAQNTFTHAGQASDQVHFAEPSKPDLSAWCDGFEKSINIKIDALSDTAINAALAKGSATMPTTQPVTADTVRGNLHRFFAEDFRTYLNDVYKLLPDDMSRVAVADNIGLSSAPSIVFIDGELNSAKMNAFNRTLSINSLMLVLPYEEWRHILSHEMTHYLIQGKNRSTFQYRFVMEGLTEFIALSVSDDEKWGGKNHYPEEVALVQALCKVNCGSALFDWYTSSENWDRHLFVAVVSDRLAMIPQIGDRSIEFASAWIDRWEVESVKEQTYQLKISITALIQMRGLLSATDIKKMKDLNDSLQPIRQIARDLASVGLRLKADPGKDK